MRGYCEEARNLLGKKARIPKGTPYYKCGQKETRGKESTVKIVSVLPGLSIRVGWVNPDGTPYYSGHAEWQLRMYGNMLGIDTSDGFEGRLYALAYQKPSSLNPDVIELWVDIRDPRISWVGSGGFWCDANVNDVEILEGGDQ